MNSSTKETRSATEKYVFDTVFDSDGAILAERPKKKTSYNPEEVEALRLEAHAAGRREAEGEMAAALGRIGGQMAQVLSTLIEERTSIRAEAVELAVAVSKKLSGALLNLAPKDAVIELLSSIIEYLRDAPRIVVRAAPDLVAALKEDLGQLLSQAGFEGQLIVLPEPDLAAADCSIDWAKGGLEHNTEASVAIIDKAVENFLVAARLADEMADRDANTANQVIGK